MGLDMYLTKETYIGAYFEHKKVHGTININAEGKKLGIQIKRIETVIERVGYWRKANEIHKWFVDNVQDGKDECQKAYVTKEKMEELLKICNDVLSDHSKADILLPTQEGFFFGGTQYDEYYFQDLEDTKKILGEVLTDKYFDSGDFYYQSSW